MKKYFVALMMLLGMVFVSCFAFGCKKKDECQHTNCEWVVVNEADCDVKGKKEYRCTDCGEVIKTTFTASLGHEYGEWVVDTEATCTEDGSKHRECARCQQVDTKAIEKLGHRWNDWVTDTERSCETKGYYHRVCLVCGEVENIEDEPRGHHFSRNEITILGTCQSQGFCEGYCDDCGKFVVTPITGLIHNWSEWEYTKVPGCFGHVTGTRKCADCGEVQQKEFVMRHSYVNGVCEYCGRKEPDENGQTVTFGSFPQSAVKEATLLATLNSFVTEFPTAEDASLGGWKSFGYDDSDVENYVWYMDVEVDGSKYRAVYYSAKRAGDSYYYLYPSTEGVGEVHWFKWEPLTWTVLENKEDSQLLLCNTVVDLQRCLNHFDWQTDKARSRSFDSFDICAWLNETFYQWAFSSNEQAKVVAAQVPMNGEDETRSEFKVFLLSESDIRDSVFDIYEETPIEYYHNLLIEKNEAVERPLSDYAKLFAWQSCDAILLRDDFYNDGEPSIFWSESSEFNHYEITALFDILPMIVISK